MARTYTPDSIVEMTLTAEELSKFNYYCFVEWGVNLDMARRIFASGLKVRERASRINRRRYLRKKEAAANPPPRSPSSTDSETKQALIAAAQRARMALTPPTTPPKTPSPPDSYPPTPSPGAIPRIVPTGMDTSDYVTE